MTSLVESSVETEARHSLRENQLEAELGAKESEVTSLAERLAGLKEKHDAVIAADEGKMSIEEHVQQLQDLKKYFVIWIWSHLDLRLDGCVACEREY